jgi:hypothetical protein
MLDRDWTFSLSNLQSNRVISTYDAFRASYDFTERTNAECAGESVYPAPIGAPFSATERFIKKTTSVSTSITTANSQKQSK